jgi:Escherichia/Staphylococcus phage prohead protease
VSAPQPDPPRLLPGEAFNRTFAPLLEVRSAGKGGDGRTIEGIAVPFLRRQRIDDYLTEQFAPGAFDHQIRAGGAPGHTVYFTLNHQSQGGVIIGKALELRNDAAGLWGAFRVSATRDGDDVLALVGDGVLTELSVGFRAAKGGDHVEPDGTVTRVRADLREVSIVPAGAYGQAATIMAVRAAEQAGTTYRPPARRVDQAAELIARLAERKLPDLPE